MDIQRAKIVIFKKAMDEAQEGGPGWISPEQHRTARAMAGYGAPRASIASYLRMDVRRLNELLGAELEQAEAEANTKVAQALFRMATKQNNVAAAIFWMKARGGWREKHEVEATVTSEVRSIQVITGVTRAEDLRDAPSLRIATPGRGRMPGEPGEGG